MYNDSLGILIGIDDNGLSEGEGSRNRQGGIGEILKDRINRAKCIVE